jgi:hypothetical protein
MAVQSDTSSISYTGNNSTSTSYAVPFVFLENAHLKAIAKTSAGVETAVTLTNHTGAGDVNGGTVRTAVAVPATSTLTIFRDVPITQTTTYAEGGDFPAASHERALDKLTQITQQLDRGLDRAVRFSESSPQNELPTPPTGTQIITATNGALGWTQERQLPTYPTTSGTQALVTGGSGQAASWQPVPSIATGPITATESTTPRFLSDRFADSINILDYGADSSGVANSKTAIRAAIAACPANGCIVFPKGTYLIDTSVADDPIVIPSTKSGIRLQGLGGKLICTTKVRPDFFTIEASNAVVDGLSFDGFWRSGDSYTSLFVTDNPNCGFMVRLHGQNAVVSNCVFTNSAGTAVTSRDGVGSVKSGGHRILNNAIENVYSGITFGSTNSDNNSTGLTGYVASGNIIKNNGFLGIRGENCRGIQCYVFAPHPTTGAVCPPLSRIVMANNVLHNAGDLNVELYGGHLNVSISGNSIEGGYMGVSLGGCDVATVTGNTIVGSRQWQLEIAQSNRVTVTGNTLACRKADGTFPANSIKNCINISDQGLDSCNDLTISGNTFLDAVCALFTNATNASNVVIANNLIKAEATVFDALNYVFNTSGTRNNWLIADNIIHVTGTQMQRVLHDGGGNLFNCRFIGNTLVGECMLNAIGFGNNGWLDVQNNNFRDFTSATSDSSQGFINTTNVTNVSFRNNLTSDYESLQKWIPDSQARVQELVRNQLWIQQLRLGDSLVTANNGTWSNWASTPNHSQKEWSCQQSASTASGWARASVYEFLFDTGSTNTTPANIPFVFRCYAALPADGLSTTFVWGSQLNEQGGALTARGLRFTASSSSGSNTLTCTLGVHNGTSEQTQTFSVTTAEIRNLLFVWEPSGTGSPALGSKFYVFSAGRSSAPSLRATLTTSAAFNSSFFAGSGFSVIAHSSSSTPAYSANWGLANLVYYHA